MSAQPASQPARTFTTRCGFTGPSLTRLEIDLKLGRRCHNGLACLPEGSVKGVLSCVDGSSYISGDLAEWLGDRCMKHVRGAPYHPQTQGKIERWHQALKNHILLENYFLPGDLEAQIEAFIEHYYHQRYHESLGNVTPADAYFGRDKAILAERARIKRITIEHRCLQHRKLAA